MNNGREEKGEIIIYQTDDGSTKIDVRFENDTVWLTQQQMATLLKHQSKMLAYILETALMKENWMKIQLSRIP